MEMLRFFLIPFGALYGWAVWIRNKLFDWGIIHSESFPLPVIAIGNLAAGGTGKTPVTEYLVRLLARNYKIAIVSRGYKRKSKGFVLGTSSSSYEEIGDEPMQYVNKFPGIIVAVDENRKRCIQKVLQSYPETEVILLDDAYQHRYVRAGFYILLTDYYNLYYRDHLLPAGFLREPKSGAKRADIILVTKTPRIYSPILRRQMTEDLNPLINQPLFFSYIQNDKLLPVYHSEITDLDHGNITTIFLLTGIVNTDPLEEFLRPKCREMVLIKYPDHHNYSMDEMIQLKKRYTDYHARIKIIITTEKDAMRLRDKEFENLFADIPFYFIPVTVELHKEDKIRFDKQITDYVRKNTANR